MPKALQWKLETCPRCQSPVKMLADSPMQLPEECPNCIENSNRVATALGQQPTPIVNPKLIHNLLNAQANDSARITALQAEVTVLTATVKALLSQLGVKPADVGAQTLV
jgi:hypothetical protein